MIVAPSPAGIPVELRDLPQWVRWRTKQSKGGKPSKAPVNPRTETDASVIDPSTWGTLRVCIYGTRGHAEPVSVRVGFVFTADDPYFGIDLDGCRDPATGGLTTEAAATVARFGTYAEPSISGTGVHLIGRGRIPGEGNRTGKVEVYDRGRFFVMTGRPLPGHDAIADCQDTLDAWHRETFPARQTRTNTSVVNIGGAADVDDRDLLRRCEGSEKFRRLFAGDLSDYGGNHSSADLGFLDVVVRNGGTPEQADRLLRSSGLTREKWDEKRGETTYGQRTIARAFDGTVQPDEPAHRPVVGVPDDRAIARTAAASKAAGVGGPCAGKDAEVARLRVERDEARRTVAMVVQTVMNPYLTPSEMRLQVSALSQAAAKQARGEVEPDGRVRLTPAEVGRDFRPKPEPGQPRLATNPRDGSKPLVPRDEVKPRIEALAERGILRAKTRPAKRARADGSTYNDVDILVEVPDRLSDAYAASATWTPEEPKARAPYTRRRPCPSCGEAHPLTRTDACQGCGAVVARSTVQPPIETVEAEPEPSADAPMAGNNPPISYVTPPPVEVAPLGRKKSSHSGDGESAMVQRLRRDRATPADAIAARLRARASPNGDGRHEPGDLFAGAPDPDPPIELFPPGRYADLTDAAVRRAGP